MELTETEAGLSKSNGLFRTRRIWLCVVVGLILLLLIGQAAWTYNMYCRLISMEHVLLNIQGKNQGVHLSSQFTVSPIVSKNIPLSEKALRKRREAGPTKNTDSGPDAGSDAGHTESGKESSVNKRPKQNRRHRDKQATKNRKKIEKLRKENKKHFRKLNAEIKHVSSKLGELRSRGESVRLDASLDPEIEIIAKRNPEQEIKMAFGTIINGTIIPNKDLQYTFWRHPGDSPSALFKFQKDFGAVMVQRKGTYFVYAQMMFQEQAPRTAFSVRSKSPHGSSPWQNRFSCLATTTAIPAALVPSDYDWHTEGYHMCSTVGVLQLEAGSLLDVKALYVGQPVVTNPANTYWGVVLLREES